MNPTRSLLFPPTSRYHSIETVSLLQADGSEVVYLKRRFVPSPDRFTVLQEHVVTEGERLDNITARYLGDPLQFWRVCDANNAMNPHELTAEIGRQPWLIYGLMRTADGSSAQVGAGSSMFTLMGFMGLYLLLGLLFVFMICRELNHGPEAATEGGH